MQVCRAALSDCDSSTVVHRNQSQSKDSLHCMMEWPGLSSESIPMVEDVCDDDGEEAEKQDCGAGVHHWVENVHGHQGETWEV